MTNKPLSTGATSMTNKPLSTGAAAAGQSTGKESKAPASSLTATASSATGSKSAGSPTATSGMSQTATGCERLASVLAQIEEQKKKMISIPPYLVGLSEGLGYVKC